MRVARLTITGLHEFCGQSHAARAPSIWTFPRASSPCWSMLPGVASTLLRSIAGLEQMDRGSIEIDGEGVDDMRPRDRNVAMMFQNYALDPYMNVYENIATTGAAAPASPASRRPSIWSRKRPTLSTCSPNRL
jgi:multiple sugar transport system ATP-binding protein